MLSGMCVAIEYKGVEAQSRVVDELGNELNKDLTEIKDRLSKLK